jgi:hypothetical protein
MMWRMERRRKRADKETMRRMEWRRCEKKESR